MYLQQIFVRWKSCYRCVCQWQNANLSRMHVLELVVSELVPNSHMAWTIVKWYTSLAAVVKTSTEKCSKSMPLALSSVPPALLGQLYLTQFSSKKERAFSVLRASIEHPKSHKSNLQCCLFKSYPEGWYHFRIFIMQQCSQKKVSKNLIKPSREPVPQVLVKPKHIVFYFV